MRSKATWLWGALSLSGAILIALVTRRVGPIAVSDDDFARVVIAQTFALSPSWDPSGTSWLPVPFFLDGAILSVFGQDLEVARFAALFRTGLGTVLLFGAGLLLGLSGFVASLCALVPLLLPTTRIFAIATVPEYFTACLATFSSVALLRNEKPANGFSFWLGVACLGLATLSRYEAWPFAFAIALRLCWARLHENWIPGLLCLLGPVLWLVHGAHRHGSSLFFVDRVRSYKLALGADSRTLLETLVSYAHALWTHEPLLLGILLLAILSRGIPVRRGALALLTPALVQLVFLSLGDATSSAPTHHPERAIMVFWTTLPLVSAWSLHPRFRSRHAARFAVPAVGLALGVNFLLPRPAPAYVQRDDEESVGRALRELQSEPQRTLIASLDFSYLATIAAAGHPERFVVTTTGDPRDSSNEPILMRVRRALGASEVDWLVLPLCFDPEELRKGSAVPFKTRFESKDYRILEREHIRPRL